MKINLLPSPPPILRVRIGLFALILASLAAMSVYFGVVWHANQISMAGENELLTEQMSELGVLGGQWANLQSEQSNLQLVQQMQAIQSSSGRASVGLSAVYEDLPLDAVIQQLSYNSGFVSLQAVFGSLSKAAHVIERFQNDPSFAAVNVSTVTSSSDGSLTPNGISVSLSVQLAKSQTMGGDR